MHYGTIRYWEALKGFGFITTDDDEEVFLHASDLAMNLKQQEVTEGLRVKFDIKNDMKGDKAVNVRRA